MTGTEATPSPDRSGRARELRSFALLIGLAAASAQAQAQEFPAAGQVCVTCHGRDGIGTSPLFPNLAGQSAVYTIQQMENFRSGERPSEVMGIIAQPLTDQQIRELALYYESLGAGCPCE